MADLCVFLLQGWLFAAGQQNVEALKVSSLLRLLKSGSDWRVNVRTEVPLVVDDRAAGCSRATSPSMSAALRSGPTPRLAPTVGCGMSP